MTADVTADVTAGLLAAARAEAEAAAAELAGQLAAVVASSADDNADDEHDPEGATIAFERAQIAGLLEVAQTRIREIDQALQRVTSGRYGVCAGCGDAIGDARLQARPATELCVRCAGRAGNLRR